jgi:amino acid transporter
MGRENDLPGGQWLGRTNHHGVPVNATLAVTGIGLLILIVNLNNPKAFNVVVALGIVLIYLAYLGATLVGLKKRLGGWPEEPASSGLFTLRKPWGMVVNIVAVIYGGVMLVNLAWPRAEFYGTEWYQQYAVVIFVPVLIVAGLCYRAATRNRADAIDADIDPEPEALTA